MPKLVYGSAFEKNTFSVIELHSDELVRAFESGNVTIKGLAEDEAVLCTDTATYSVRQVNTSNSMLLVIPESNNEMTVVDDLSSSIELIPCLARLQRIDSLLRDTSYAGHQREAELKEKTFYTYTDLLSLVQASEAELRQGLEERNAFELNGYCRVVDQSHLHRLFDVLVSYCILQDIDVKAIPLGVAKQMIREGVSEDEEYLTGPVPDQAIIACLRSFATNTNFGLDDDIVCLDEARVCNFLGRFILLSEKGKEWLLEDFMEMWKRLTPDVFSPSLDMLKGLCICNERVAVHQNQIYVSYFPVAELSTDPAQRFASLFAEKKLWSVDEIRPYIEDLASDRKKQESLLLKFTRIQKTKGKVFHGSRVK
ncbi:sister chromatid cohesion protein Dcc1 [Phycomyces nitens]|nr:sister chromatid cohesion protein Dcc1 [Phycomyces nitens]